jgi:hypothetical protein
MFKPSRLKYDVLLNTRSSSSSQPGPIGPTGPIGSTGPTGPATALFNTISIVPTVLTNRYVALTINGVTYNVVSISVPRLLEVEE